MHEAPTKVDRMLALICLVATLAAFAVNGFGSLGLINGLTTAAAAGHAGGLLTPADYAFSIWLLIFVGLLAFSVYQLLPDNLARFRRVRVAYIFSCIVYSSWLYFWHQGLTGLGFASTALLWLLLLLTETRRRCFTATEIFVVQAPFGLFFGWTTALVMMHLGLLLESLDGRSAKFAACFAIVGVTVAAITSRIKLGNFFFPLAIAWALTAIAVRQGNNTSIVVATAFGVVICMVTTGSFVVDLRDSTSE